MRVSTSRWLDGSATDCRASSDPEISLIVPTRNRPALASRAVRSALHQRGVAIEVIVVDDGSTTGPIDPAQWDGDRRVVVLRHEKSAGVAAARNTGLATARAPWVAFLDDDDRWHPDKTAMQLRALAADRSAQWCFTAACTRDVVGRVVCVERVSMSDAPLERQLLVGNVVPGGGSSVLARTDFVRRLGGFDETFQTLADWDLWIRLATASPAAVVNSVLVDYLINPAGMSANDAVITDEFDLLRQKHADAAARLGVAFDEIQFLRYVAFRRRMAGWRRGAAAAEFFLAKAERSPTQLLRVARAGIWPRPVLSRRDPDSFRGWRGMSAVPVAGFYEGGLA